MQIHRSHRIQAVLLIRILGDNFESLRFHWSVPNSCWSDQSLDRFDPSQVQIILVATVLKKISDIIMGSDYICFSPNIDSASSHGNLAHYTKGAWGVHVASRFHMSHHWGLVRKTSCRHECENMFEIIGPNITELSMDLTETTASLYIYSYVHLCTSP